MYGYLTRPFKLQSGNDANPSHRNGAAGCTYWGAKNTSNPNPSPFYTQGFTYTYNPHTGQAPSQEFPGVPYGPQDFHCERSLNSWTDPLTLNAGWLDGLTDLNTGRENVRERIADYLTDLLSVGFSGFRIDAAKRAFFAFLIKRSDLTNCLDRYSTGRHCCHSCESATKHGRHFSI